MYDCGRGAIGNLPEKQCLQLALVTEPNIQLSLSNRPTKLAAGNVQRALLAKQYSVKAQHARVMGDACASIAAKQIKDAHVEVRVPHDANYSVEVGTHVRQRIQRAHARDMLQLRRLPCLSENMQIN
jgi:hypothetical protein